MNGFTFELQRFAVYGSSYNDTLYVTEGYSYVYAYGGNDSIYNSAAYDGTRIYAGDGNDTVYNDVGYYLTIDGGAGSDRIYSYAGRYSSISGGADNDIISLGGSQDSVTVNGGTGNDIIYGDSGSYGVVYQFYYGDGNDSLFNYKANDTISVGGNYYTTLKSGNNVLVSIYGSDAMTVFNTNSVNVRNGTFITNRYDNYNKNSLVSGTAYADSIYNSAGGATIHGNGGNDYIHNSTSASYTIKNSYGYVTIDGGEGNDTIYSYDPYVSINGGVGADKIYTGNWQNVTINGGTGNDTIYGNNNSYGILYQYAYGDGYDSIIGYTSNDSISITGGSWSTVTSGNNVIVKVAGSNAITLSGAKGKKINIYPLSIPVNTVITNYNDKSIVSGSSSNDIIYNYGDKDTINAGSGNDKIYNRNGDYALINLGDGNDSIYGNNDYTTVNGGTGTDTVTGNHWRSRINGDGDNDLISITTYWYNSIYGGDGNDTIIAGGSEHLVNGGAGADRISLSGDKLTVSGGLGNDSIVGNTTTSHLYQYAYGDGYDTIYNWSGNDTLSISGGKYTRSTVGNNVVIGAVNNNGVANGAITLSGAKGKNIYIKGTEYVPVPQGVTLSNYNSNTVISGTSYVDSINNHASNVTVNTADNNDTILSNASRVSLNGGAGADLISVASDSSYSGITIKGGLGNDKIYGNSLGSYGVLYQYAQGDGYDVIYGYKTTDSISITGADSWTTVTSGNNVLVNVTNNGVSTGTITLSGASDKTINVYPKSSTITQKEIIQRFMKSLDTTNKSGVAALNEAVKYATNDHFSSMQDAINKMVIDCRSVNNANTFLKNYCGIDLTNDDTGAITGYDANSSTYQKTASGIVPETTALESFTGSSFQTNGLTVYLRNIPYDGQYIYTPTSLSYSSLSNETKRYIWKGFKTWSSSYCCY